jgi:hypothetical protein
MGDIIQFPFNGQDGSPVEKLLTQVREICHKEGVSDVVLEQAISEARPYIESLVSFKVASELCLVGDVSFSNEQVEIVNQAHKQCVNEFGKVLYERLVYASHVFVALALSKHH